MWSADSRRNGDCQHRRARKERRAKPEGPMALVPDCSPSARQRRARPGSRAVGQQGATAEGAKGRRWSDAREQQRMMQSTPAGGDTHAGRTQAGGPQPPPLGAQAALQTRLTHPPAKKVVSGELPSRPPWPTSRSRARKGLHGSRGRQPGGVAASDIVHAPPRDWAAHAGLAGPPSRPRHLSTALWSSPAAAPAHTASCAQAPPAPAQTQHHTTTSLLFLPPQ
mgnify:CR=1 FL=1